MSDQDITEELHEGSQEPVEKVGVTLKAEREKRNISVDDIKEQLKIRPRLLQAIECGLYKELPDATTVGALVKSYANFLGLDGAVFSQNYRDEMQGMEKKVEIDFPEMLPSHFKISTIAIAVSLLVLIITAFVGWSYYMRKDPFVTQDNWTGLIEDPVLETLVKPEIIEDVLSEDTLPSVAHNFPLPAPEVEVELPQNMLLIAQEEESWIEIKNKNNKVLFSAILKKGQSYEIPDQEGLVLKTGNGAALRLQVGAKIYDIFSKKGRITRNFSLDRQNLEMIVNKQKAL